MVGKIRTAVVSAFAFLAFCTSLPAQQNEQSDGVVRLMKGSSLQLVEVDGVALRKAIDATFLHNGTYLICDTALWNVDAKVINAFGHVQIIQDETVLSSEYLDYSIDENLAQFHGTLVQLKDKQNNTLRTRFLDYNTKDSVAVFRDGGSMRDKDGQIIESLEGTYDSKAGRFTFKRNVNMFTDSVFVKTSELDYESKASKAWFRNSTDFWKDGNMMSASRGWYDRNRQIFFFEGHVHATSEEQESWSDTLYFYRDCNDVLLLGNAQVQDTTRNIAALADRIFYVDSLSRVTLQRRAAVAVKTEEEEKVDTLYFGADTLVYYTMRRCDIPEAVVKTAEGRLAEMFVDPVLEYRQKAAKEAAEAAAQAAKDDPNRPPEGAGKMNKGPEEAPTDPEEQPEQPGQEAQPEESAEEVKPELPDSLKVEPLPDTTKVGFLEGIHNVRMFRKDMQVKADSLRYNDLDSIARFYIDPVVWNEGNRQYSSDSLFTLVRDGGIDRASLMSNAFILTREDSLCFDQIKATEVMAYFDTASTLRRFDALGGATAYFYLQENDAFATLNKVESKMLSATFLSGELDRVYYYESPKNDAYPVAQLRMEDQRMRGFNWQEDKRPASRYDITSLELKPSERSEYARHPRAEYKQTDIYFPGYIASVYRSIEIRDSLKLERQKEEQLRESLKEMEKEEASAEEASTQEEMQEEAPVEEQKEGEEVQPETAEAPVEEAHELTESEKKAAEKAAKKAAAEARRQARIAKREARWAELDARDAAKAAAKEAKKLERKRRLTRKALILQQKQAAKDSAKLEKYKARYIIKKAREDARKAENVPDTGADTSTNSEDGKNTQ